MAPNASEMNKYYPFWVWTRAVEPDFKKSNNKPDAKVGYRRLYPTFRLSDSTALVWTHFDMAVINFQALCRRCRRRHERVLNRAVEPDFKKSNNKPDAKVGYRRLYPTLHSKGCC